MTAHTSNSQLWEHCIRNILVLDTDDLRVLKKGGITSINHLFQYCTNIEMFNTRFPDNSPTIMNVRYFIIHCHVNGYTTNASDLMYQSEETFGAIYYIRLESRYWEVWILTRQAELTTPSSQQSNTVFTTTDTELQSIDLAPVGRLYVVSSSLTGIGGQLSHTASSTKNSHDDTRRKLNINKTCQFHSKHCTQLAIKSKNTTTPQNNKNETSCH